MYQLTCTGTSGGTGVVQSCARVAVGEPGSININRNPIGGIEFQGAEMLSLLISLSDAVLICLDESVQKRSGRKVKLLVLFQMESK